MKKIVKIDKIKRLELLEVFSKVVGERFNSANKIEMKRKVKELSNRGIGINELVLIDTINDNSSRLNIKIFRRFISYMQNSNQP